MMAGFWAWYTKPVRPRWAYTLLSALILFAGMFATASYWGDDLAVTAIMAAAWGFAGTVVARLIMKALTK